MTKTDCFESISVSCQRWLKSDARSHHGTAFKRPNSYRKALSLSLSLSLFLKFHFLWSQTNHLTEALKGHWSPLMWSSFSFQKCSSLAFDFKNFQLKIVFWIEFRVNVQKIKHQTCWKTQYKMEVYNTMKFLKVSLIRMLSWILKVLEMVAS